MHVRRSLRTWWPTKWLSLKRRWPSDWCSGWLHGWHIWWHSWNWSSHNWRRRLLWWHIRSHILRRRSLRLHLGSRGLHRGNRIRPRRRRLTRHALWHRRSSMCTLSWHLTPSSGWLSCRWWSLYDPSWSLSTKAWLQILPMNHHGCSLLSSTKTAKFRVMSVHTNTHVDIIHHFCKDDTFTAFFLHDHI